ncbi:hypothetical protein MA16_Dca004366 [Dendrobium catenatum]|uniref:Uncharacterized protein n=1 Tax=Dendrobium catenatum TaxID=906689 RepID=A0A2I0W785_9ASPA|nr:hypothetical protein MA16_Dca004366 [Dendrobium catenatum]
MCLEEGGIRWSPSGRGLTSPDRRNEGGAESKPENPRIAKISQSTQTKKTFSKVPCFIWQFSGKERGHKGPCDLTIDRNGGHDRCDRCYNGKVVCGKPLRSGRKRVMAWLRP